MEQPAFPAGLWEKHQILVVRNSIEIPGQTRFEQVSSLAPEKSQSPSRNIPNHPYPDKTLIP
jgi:hypothetical protein